MSINSSNIVWHKASITRESLEKKKYSESQLISSKQAIRELGYGSQNSSIRAAKSIKNYFRST